MNNAQTIAAVGFDISNLTGSAAAALVATTYNVDVLFDDDGNPTAGFVIVGKNSPEYQAESHAVRAEGHKRSAIRKAALDVKTDEGASKLVDIIDDNSTRLALAVVKDWYGFTSAGAPVPYEKKHGLAAFQKFPVWEEKVNAALEVDNNFLKVSSPASSPSPAASSND
jgi:hypothetical protein